MIGLENDEPTWQSGDVAVLRYVTRGGVPGMSWPTLVARDEGDLLALFVPRGTLHKRWDSSRRLVDIPWRYDTLRLMFSGASHSIWLFWDEGEFIGWYVNLEEPFRRTPIGFDTNDHQLDVVVTPDLSWELKDSDVLDAWTERGIYSREFAAAVREEAQHVIAIIERGGSPFCDGWESWKPDPPWTPPTHRDHWDMVPAALWERRDWAYLVK